MVFRSGKTVFCCLLFVLAFAPWKRATRAMPLDVLPPDKRMYVEDTLNPVLEEQQKKFNLQLMAPANLTRKGINGQEENYVQVMWPDHCIQGTPGADFCMKPLDGEHIQPKGTRLEFDSYSAVKDDGGEQTGLAAHLREKKIDTCICIGLASDFCVKFTAVDLKAEGFKVYAIPELCRDTGLDKDFS